MDGQIKDDALSALLQLCFLLARGQGSGREGRWGARVFEDGAHIFPAVCGFCSSIVVDNYIIFVCIPM